MRIFTTFIVSLILSGSYGQYDLDWAVSYGTTTDELVNDICTDNEGNTYLTGYFFGTVDFDPGPGVHNLSSMGATDIFIQKIDSEGNFVWAHGIGGSTFDAGTTIALDNNGSVYVAGDYKFTVDFDPGAGVSTLSSSPYNCFILKLDTAGLFQWVKGLESNGNCHSFDIALDSDENVFLVGDFINTIDLDPGTGSTNYTTINTASDGFIVKLDSIGSFHWGYGFGDVNGEEARAVSIDPNDNVVMVGRYANSLDFDFGPGTFLLNSNNNSFDTYIAKYDNNGIFEWAGSFGGSHNNEYVENMTTDNYGNIYIAGEFQMNADFDPTSNFSFSTSQGINDIFLVKVDSAGSYDWHTTVGLTGNDILRGLTTDSEGHVYLSGYYTDSIDLDPGTANADYMAVDGWDAFLLKLNSDGSYNWSTGFGASLDEGVFDIQTDSYGNLYCSGYFQSSVSPSIGNNSQILTNAGGNDVFLMKVKTCKSFSTINEMACNQYVSPSGIIYNSSGTIHDTIQNNAGCDSIIVIDLTLNTIDTGVSLNGVTLTADLSGATYQWVDCDNGNSPITGETSQSFTPTAINGNYAVQVSDSVCTALSSCFNIDFSSVYELGPLESESQIEYGIIYPNPSDGFFTLESTAITEITQLAVFDPSGQLIQTLQLMPGQINIQLDLLKGVYFFHFSSNSYTHIEQIIIAQ